MTTKELQIEWEVTYQTRLGCLCGSREPTGEQKAIAKAEADRQVARLLASSTYQSPPEDEVRVKFL